MVEFQPKRNEQLDGLRGFAAVAVAVYHSILGVDISQIQRILQPSIQHIDGVYGKMSKIVLAIFNGETAVVIFFVLSGAVLFNSLIRNQQVTSRVAASFLVRRFLRIYPTLFVCLVACALVFSIWVRPQTLEQFATNAVLYEFPINGATWTLNVELWAAPFILLAYWGYTLGREWGLFAVILLVYLLKLPLFAPYLMLFKAYWYCFAIGMLIPTRVGAWFARVLPVKLWLPALIVMLLARHVMLFGGPKTAERIQQTCAGVLVVQLYYGRAGALGAFLQNKVSVFLGRISYSFYLWNVLFLEIVCEVLRGQPWAVERPLEAGLLGSVVVIALTIPLAYLSMKYLEEPSIRLGGWCARAITSRTPAMETMSQPASRPTSAS
jgi:peptidoglycan/LPS O-acetylase OafA/YrhL